jgi:probable HAF family extracellular repeat protein
MKSTKMINIYAILLFAALAVPSGLTAQDRNDHNKHHHYKVIDLGTFGGPMSFLNLPFNGVPALSNSGITVGDSATHVQISATSNPFLCGGPLGNVPNIFHTFARQNGAVSDLGALGNVAENCSNAGSVNSNGDIAGTSEIDDVDPVLGFKEVRAVRWDNGEITDLGTLGGPDSLANVGSINNRGRVVGAALNAVPDPFSLFDMFIFGSPNGTQTRAFLWQRNAMKDLGTLGGPDAWAVYVNDRSQVAGWSYTNSIPNSVTGLPNMDPFLWTQNKMIDLGTFGGAYGYPSGLNNQGWVIGQSGIAANPAACFSLGDPDCHPFLWKKGKLTDLNTSTAGGSPILAFGINDSGEIVGGAVFHNVPLDAYLWRKGLATDLGHLSDCGSLAFTINSNGQVVGGTFSCADGTHSHAFLWENGTMVDLDTLVPTGSPLRLVEAVTINDRGEIAGNGVPPGVARKDFNTLGHAFLLIPCDERHSGVEGCDYSLVDASTLPEASAPEREFSGTSVRPFQSLRSQFPFGNRGLGRPLMKGEINGEREAEQRTNGERVPIVVFRPSSLNFGTVQDGETKTLATTLTNTGTTKLIISSVKITGTNPAYFSQTNTCGTHVFAGKSCVITVKFKPLGRGQHFTADVSVSDNAKGSPQQVPLSGIGEQGYVGYCAINSQTNELDGTCIGPGLNQCQSKYNPQQCPVGAKPLDPTNLTCGFNVVRVDAGRNCID